MGQQAVAPARDNGHEGARRSPGLLVATLRTDRAKSWRNKVEGNAEAASVHDMKSEAVERSRLLADYRSRKLDTGTVEYIVRNMDGTIGYRNTYPRSRFLRGNRLPRLHVADRWRVDSQSSLSSGR